MKLRPRRSDQFPGLAATHLFWCPACGYLHWIDSRWTVTGTEERPTVRASVLVDNPGLARCHLFITDGRLEYLGDSTHALAGQTVEMADLDEDLEPTA